MRSQAPGWQRYSPYTRTDYEQCAAKLLEIFGDVRTSDIDATDVARYLRKERADAPVRANREVALLSNLIGLAIERGEAKHNPCRQVRRNEEQPRSEAPQPEEFAAFATWLAAQGGQRAIIGMAAEYAAGAGSRKVEFLDLSWPQIDEAAGHVRVKRAKQRGRKRGEVIEQIEITPQMTALLARLKVVRNQQDKGLSLRLSDALWHRVHAVRIQGDVAKADGRGGQEEGDRASIHLHDLRAYYVTQHKAERGALPDLHANAATTARVYDRSKIVRRRAL